MHEDQTYEITDQASTPRTVSDSPSISVQPAVSAAPKSRLGLWLAAAFIVLIAIGSGIIWALRVTQIPAQPAAAGVGGHQNVSTTAAPQVQGLQLDTSKKYGDAYAGGLLPVGDGKYVTAGPKTGYVFACGSYAQNLTSSQGGADSRGPWFTNKNTQYDINKKAQVAGNVTWKSVFSNTVSGASRIITTNDLPAHSTGIFPIALADPAYAYDRNPNSIRAQSLSYMLPANPIYGTPHCMGGEAEMMTTGVALFNAFDAGGRDAGAWEVQDGCSGHPQMSGEYHYHTLSRCIKDASASTVIGFALDGFPITGPRISDHNILATADLDECHGIVSQIDLDGKNITTYHYVMTEDFPYSVSCFRAQPVTTDSPAGQPAQPPNAPPR